VTFGLGDDKGYSDRVLQKSCVAFKSGAGTGTNPYFERFFISACDDGERTEHVSSGRELELR
jgi:hypothetical protein